MRTYKVAIVVLFTILAMALSAAATPAAPPAITNTVIGGGFVAPTEDMKITLAFTALKDAQGDVKGEVQLAQDGIALHADVFDMEVIDNEAIIVSTITTVNNPDFSYLIGEELILFVIDDGQGANAVDELGAVMAGFPLPLMPFTGNIMVR